MSTVNLEVVYIMELLGIIIITEMELEKGKNLIRVIKTTIRIAVNMDLVTELIIMTCMIVEETVLEGVQSQIEE